MSTAPAVVVRVGAVPPANLKVELQTVVRLPVPSWIKVIEPALPTTTLETVIVVMLAVRVTLVSRKVEKSKVVVVPKVIVVSVGQTTLGVTSLLLAVPAYISGRVARAYSPRMPALL